MIDHRNAGAPQPDMYMRAAGLPNGSGRGLFETAMIMCHRCQFTWAVNKQRTRPRNYCKRHDKYLCDNCAAQLAVSGQICRSMKETVEAAYNAAEKGLPVISPFT
jgi:hypothetical protein